MIIATFSGISGNLALFVWLFVVAASVSSFALYKKGDVRAVLSHGKTMLVLEAKERNSEK